MEIKLQSEAGNARQLLKSCIDLFWLLIQKISPIEGLKQEQELALRSEYGRFYVWAQEFYPENGRLDEIFQLSGNLRDQTMSLLVAVGRTLCSRGTGVLVSDITDSTLVAQRQELTSLIGRLDKDANKTEEFDTHLEVLLGSVLKKLQFDIGGLIELTDSLKHPAFDPVEVETGPGPTPKFIWGGSADPAEWAKNVIRLGGTSDGELLEETEKSGNKEYGMLAPQAKSVVSTDASSRGKLSAATTELTFPTYSIEDELRLALESLENRVLSSSTAVRHHRVPGEQYSTGRNSHVLVNRQRLPNQTPAFHVAPALGKSNISARSETVDDAILPDLSHSSREQDMQSSMESRASSEPVETTRAPNNCRTRKRKRMPYYCLYPGCDASFDRVPDLVRHQGAMHSTGGCVIDCPEDCCGRSGPREGRGTGGFSRLDHFREHVKKVHGKELVKDDEGDWCVKSSDGQMRKVHTTGSY